LHLAEHWVIAGLAFIGIFFLALPFPLIIVIAATFGFIRASQVDVDEQPVRVEVSALHSLKTTLIWLVVWGAPMLALAALDSEGLLLEIGVFFSKLAVVTFGGAYAVLAYLGQDVVGQFGWLSAGEMLDGLGLAETTPGPLILVTEFVGTLAAFRSGDGPAWLMGLAGAAVTLWATFAPCFAWIFTGAPYIERIGSNARLSGALSGVTAAVVGVILNIALWFALHVLFAHVTAVDHGLLRLWTPDFASFDWLAGALSLLAALLLPSRHMGVIAVLAICAGLGLAVRLVF